MSMPNYGSKSTFGVAPDVVQQPSLSPTLWALLKKHARTKPELWPLFALGGVWTVGFSFMVYWGFRKSEIVVRHGAEFEPLHWSRCKKDYEKSLFISDFFRGAATMNRIPELDQLQDEMLEVEMARRKERQSAPKGHH